MFKERRACIRNRLAWAIELPDGTAAVTQDVSAHGLYFLVPVGVPIDAWMYLHCEFGRAALRFAAMGRLVRVDPGAASKGVAVRLHGSRFMSA